MKTKKEEQPVIVVDADNREEQPDNGVYVDNREEQPNIGVNSDNREEQPDIGVNEDNREEQPEIGVNPDNREEQPVIGVNADKRVEQPDSGVDKDNREEQPDIGVSAYNIEEQPDTCVKTDNREQQSDIGVVADNREEQHDSGVDKDNREKQPDIGVNADEREEEQYICVNADNKEEQPDIGVNADNREEQPDIGVNADNREEHPDIGVDGDNREEQPGIGVEEQQEKEEIGLDADKKVIAHVAEREDNHDMNANAEKKYGNYEIGMDRDKEGEIPEIIVDEDKIDDKRKIDVNAVKTDDNHDINVNAVVKFENLGIGLDAKHQDENRKIDVVVDKNEKQKGIAIYGDITEGKHATNVGANKKDEAKESGVETVMTKDKQDIDVETDQEDEKRNDDMIADKKDEKQEFCVCAVKNVEKHEIGLDADNQWEKQGIGLDSDNTEEKQYIGLNSHKKDQGQEICVHEYKTDEKQEMVYDVVKKYKNEKIGEVADNVEDKGITNIDEVNTVDKHEINVAACKKDTGSTCTCFINMIWQKLLCMQLRKGIWARSPVNKEDTNDDIYEDAQNAEESDDIFWDAENDNKDGTDVDSIREKANAKGNINHVENIADDSIVDAANFVKKPERELKKDVSLKTNEELDASSNFTKLFTHTDEVIPQENKPTKYDSRCNDGTTINFKREGMKDLKLLKTAIGALGKAMESGNMDEVKLTKLKDIVKEIKTMTEELETCPAKHDKGDVEEKVKQTPAVPKSSHPMDDAQPASPSPKKQRCGIPGVTGLMNIGNSCYMNSTIQCLNNTFPLVDFMTYEYKDNKNNRRGQLVYQFARLVKKMWSGEHSCISPKCLKKIKVEIGRYHQSFAGSQQQDSQEFLTCLLDELNEGLNTQVEVKPQIQEQGNEALAISRLDHNLHNDTIVEELFQGQFNKTIACGACGQQIVNNQTFMYLHLPIPNKPSCTLEECVKLYFEERRVTGNCMTSPNCKERSKTVVKLEISKLPQILIIALKRFEPVSEGSGWRKIDKEVRFPMRHFDLSQFVHDPSKNKEVKLQFQKTYNLYAVSNHNGTLASGHYWACCRNPKNQIWYRFNDSEVDEVSEHFVETSNASYAYVLYYECDETHL